MGELLAQVFDVLYAFAYKCAQTVYWGVVLPFRAPDERIFIPYILSAVLLAFFAYRISSERRELGQSFFAFLFPKRVWLSQSSILDYKFYIVNRILQQVVNFSAILLSGTLIAGAVASGLVWMLGEPSQLLDGTSWGVRVAYSLLFFLAFDFAWFYGHYLLHRIPVLWEFHKVHHAATTLNPLTNFREHIVDTLVIGQLIGLTTGIVIGVFYYLCGNSIVSYSVLSVPVLFFIYNLVSNLRHSHVWLSFGPHISYVISSPAMHQLHHSSEARHWDLNYGLALSVWDWLFGTIYVPKEREQFRLGLSSRDEHEYSTVWRLYALPFKRVFEMAMNTRKKTPAALSAEDRSSLPGTGADGDGVSIKGQGS